MADRNGEHVPPSKVCQSLWYGSAADGSERGRKIGFWESYITKIIVPGPFSRSTTFSWSSFCTVESLATVADNAAASSSMEEIRSVWSIHRVWS